MDLLKLLHGNLLISQKEIRFLLLQTLPLNYHLLILQFTERMCPVKSQNFTKKIITVTKTGLFPLFFRQRREMNFPRP